MGMNKWTVNADNTHFELEKDNAHVHVQLSGGVWRIEVWLDDHCKMQTWAGRAINTALADVQALGEAQMEQYMGWVRNAV